MIQIVIILVVKILLFGIKGGSDLHSEMPEFYFFLISRYFHNLNLKYMIYTVKNKNYKKI